MKKIYIVAIILMVFLVGIASYASNIAFNKVAKLPFQLLISNNNGVNNKANLSLSSIIDKLAENYNNTATGTIATGSFSSQTVATTNAQKAAEVMRENGLTNFADAIQSNNKEQVNEAVQSMSDQEFEQALQMLRNTGHSSEADTLQILGKDQAIKLYNQMKNKK